MTRPTIALVCLFILGAVGGCKETEECRELGALQTEYRKILSIVKARAEVVPKIEKRAGDIEAKAAKLLERLGLEMPEEEIKGRLDARVSKIPGAKIERTVIPGVKTEAGDQLPEETMWSISFADKDAARAFASAESLLELPPLLRLRTILRDKKKGERWVVELLRADIERVPIKPEATPIPKRPDPASIKSVMGLCGAGKLRESLQVLEAEIKTLEPDALKASILMPSMTSWEGIFRRAEHLEQKELEARRLARLLVDAAREIKAELKAVGAEGELVVLEIWGGRSDRSRLETQLAGQAPASEVQSPEAVPSGVVRIGLPNRLAGRKKE